MLNNYLLPPKEPSEYFLYLALLIPYSPRRPARSFRFSLRLHHLPIPPPQHGQADFAPPRGTTITKSNERRIVFRIMKCFPDSTTHFSKYFPRALFATSPYSTERTVVKPSPLPLVPSDQLPCRRQPLRGVGFGYFHLGHSCRSFTGQIDRRLSVRYIRSSFRPRGGSHSPAPAQVGLMRHF